MFNLKAKDMRDAYIKFNHYLFWNNAFQYIRGGVTAHSFQDSIFMESAACDLHLHDMNYAPAKWRMLIRLYLNPVELGKMVQRLNHYNSQKKHKNKYVPDIAMQFNARDNASGACLLNLSVGFHQGQWHAVVNTRASEVTTRWFADLIFIYVLLREIGDKVGFNPDYMTLRWNMTSSYQSITGTPFFLAFEGNEQWLKDFFNEEGELIEAETVGLPHWQVATIKRYKKVFVDKNYSNFRTQERVMKAYEVLIGEREGHYVPTESLTLPGYDINHIMDKLSCDELEMFGGDGDE
jgi:hypothetical protein